MKLLYVDYIEATKRRGNDGYGYMIARNREMRGKTSKHGGYYLMKLVSGFDGRGKKFRKWELCTKKERGYREIIDYMNAKLGYTAFDYAAED